jgi:hypothetical protein
MIHIQKFVERLQGFEARGARDFTMPIKDAKDLHADVTRLLLDLNTLHQATTAAQQNNTITVDMQGGAF